MRPDISVSVSCLNTDLEIAPRSGASSCPYSWAALNVAGKPPPVDSSWHAVARSLEPPSGAIYRKGVPKKCEPSSTRDAANHSICCLRVELMQPAPELAVGKLLRTLSTDYSSQSLALQPITDVHAAPMQQSSAECILHSFLPVHLLALLKRNFKIFS